MLLWSKLADDIDKKRRIVPVRKLVEKYESILFDLVPCWLVSPEVVSTVFPLRRKLFDIIIFDEASQSAIERSLPTLYRGKNIIIMGDEKQLPPFDLFMTKDDDEEEENNENIDESLLSDSLLILARRMYGSRYLLWHYRSKYQDLIDFSNHAFYEGNLQVAPNVVRSPAKPPIRWIQCNNGTWIKRQNLPEAQLVVQQLKEIFLENKLDKVAKSVGIITFNETQKLAILNEIDARRKIDNEFDKLYSDAETDKGLDDMPFVKNIENVQGDERDKIIFSIGYAPDQEGRLHVHFGSLSQEGGENRLNVAISRARENIIIVSSIKPEDLHTELTKNIGPKRLKEYLMYAKSISERDLQKKEDVLLSFDQSKKSVQSSGVLFESHFEEIIYQQLKNLGYDVDMHIGYSGYKIDLAIIHHDDKSRYILAIECDGTTFHSAQSTRERDVMRQQFLEKRGWVVERIWSRNWWTNPDREINRIKQRVEELRSKR
jgi:superfamily I DNA and/or RNA helicase/very-short-patch-repair endonuclease